MAYTETTTVGYGQRLTNSLKGILFGFLLLIAGTVLLCWNEGRAVKTGAAIKNACKQTVEVADLSTINHELDGKMICASGFATTNDSIVDQFFGLGAVAIRIERSVEYYQCVEHSQSKTEDKVGGKQETTTTYTYSNEWVSSPVTSEFADPNHKNNNFVVLNVNDDNVQAETVTVGAYLLPKDWIGSISSRENLPVALSADKITELNKSVAKTLNLSDSLQFVTITNNQIYLGQNPNSPSIGDVRVTFTKVVPATVTIWAKVDNGKTFKRFVYKNGYGVAPLRMGSKTMEECKEDAESSNATLTWLLRLVGFLLVYFGLKGIFGLVIALLKVLPFLANIANVGISIVCGVVGFAWSLVFIAISWLLYRPILAGILIAVVVGLFIFLSKRSKEAPVPAEQPAETPAQA